MNPTLPILEPPRTPVRVDVAGRWLAAGIAAACLGVLLAAAYLAPDPAGVGTTHRLGMPPCGFRVNTGLPCAGCGFTTSFNHAVRWRWDKAVWAQPMGAALAGATVLGFWAAAYVAVTARPVHRLAARGLVGRGTRLVVLGVGFGIAAWGFKIAVTLAGIDGTGW